MYLEIICHILALDFVWVLGLIVNSPLNFFMLAALCVFAFKAKAGGLKKFFIFLFLWFTVVPIAEVLEIQLFALALPLAYMATSIFLDEFPPESIVKRHLLLVNISLLFAVGIALKLLG